MGAPSLKAAKRPGLPLPAFACAAAAIPFGWAFQPSPVDAKAPSVSYCYRSVCHRVKTVEQTRRLIGRLLVVETSYYDLPGVDRFNTGIYTSNGERFDANDQARVASADLPDGTELLLRNPINGRVSHVRVNDFGPFRGDRRLDVTRRVAEDLDFKHKGVVRLEVIVIAAPADDDLTYRRNRERRATRGHLGVVFEPEMPALISGLIAERNPAAEAGRAIAAVEKSVDEIPVPGTGPAADMVASADPVVASANADFERLVDGSSGEPQTEAVNSGMVGLTIAQFSGEVEAQPSREAAAELTPSPADQTATSPSLRTAAYLSAPETPDEADAQTTADATTSAPPAMRAESESLARATVATSDFSGALSLPTTSRNLLLVILAGLLSATLAAALSTGHRMSRRTASAHQRGAMENSQQSGSRGAEAPPVASASGAAFASVSSQTTSGSGQATRPAVVEGSRAASCIAADFAIEGQLRSTGCIEVAGRIKGRIEADELIVLAGGVVDGEVICRVLAVGGTITGTISTHELHVHDTGRVDAAIETGGMTVEPGALFEGQVRRRHFG